MTTVKNEERKYRLIEADIIVDAEDDHMNWSPNVDDAVKQFEDRLNWLEIMDSKSKISNLRIVRSLWNGLPAAIVDFDNRFNEHHSVLYMVEAS